MCVRASTYTIAAGGWHTYERRLRTPSPPCCTTPFPRASAPTTTRQRQQIKSEGGARLRYICGILCHLTRRDGGVQQCLKCAEWWVALTTRQFLTGSTRPSEKKQSELLPSTEFPDPSPSSYRVARPPWRGGNYTIEPQLWARCVNLKSQSMSRDGHFQQVGIDCAVCFVHKCCIAPVVRDFQARRHRRTCNLPSLWAGKAGTLAHTAGGPRGLEAK